ncbi:MAG: hypothetical protein J7621_15005 [Niastella sp.]|nr:hypothetical protein [Niastella sp.]
MAKRIVAYLLFGLGFLTVTFFRHYHGQLIPYPFAWWVIGVVMFLGGWLTLRSTPSSLEQYENKQVDQHIADLKAKGEQIKVNFDHVDIKENSYTEEVERRNNHDDDVLAYSLGSNTPFNDLTDSDRNTVRLQRNQCVVIYDHTQQGKTERFISPVISLDRVTLLSRLLTRQETILYVDRQDRKRYYFDLAFLNS